VDPQLKVSRALEDLKKRNPVLAAEYAKLGVDKIGAFTVAYLTAVQQIERVRDLMAAAFESGKSVEEWRDSLKDEDIQISDGHAATVWRNNTFNALNEERYERFNQVDEDNGQESWLLYEAVQDRKTRSSHRANDGLAMKRTDPRWEGRTPSLDHNCRCILIRIDADEVDSMAKFTSPKSNSTGADGFGAADSLVGRGPGTKLAEVPVTWTKDVPEAFVALAKAYVKKKTGFDIL
jgi:SPP1 gp7 family putative phage head morphogenesis protein